MINCPDVFGTSRMLKLLSIGYQSPSVNHYMIRLHSCEVGIEHLCFLHNIPRYRGSALNFTL